MGAQQIFVSEEDKKLVREMKPTALVLWGDRVRAGKMLVLRDLWACRAHLGRYSSLHLQGTVRSRVGQSPGVRSGKDDLIIS